MGPGPAPPARPPCLCRCTAVDSLFVKPLGRIMWLCPRGPAALGELMVWPHPERCLTDSTSAWAWLSQIWNSVCVCVGEGDPDKPSLTSSSVAGCQWCWLPGIVRPDCEG